MEGLRKSIISPGSTAAVVWREFDEAHGAFFTTDQTEWGGSTYTDLLGSSTTPGLIVSFGITGSPVIYSYEIVVHYEYQEEGMLANADGGAFQETPQQLYGATLEAAADAHGTSLGSLKNAVSQSLDPGGFLWNEEYNHSVSKALGLAEPGPSFQGVGQMLLQGAGQLLPHIAGLLA